MTAGSMRQYGPYPVALHDLVRTVAYRPGWLFALQDIERDPAGTHGHSAGGLTLTITISCPDSFNVTTCEHCGGAVPNFHVRHLFPVPAATFNADSWRRWLFERVLDVEKHEAMELFKLGGERAFAPTHGPGCDPYVVHEYATDEQRRTTFRGELLGS